METDNSFGKGCNMTLRTFIGGVLIFVCGMVASAALFYSHGSINEARAGSNCISESLVSSFIDGAPSADTRVVIAYSLPSCMKEMGYTQALAQVIDGWRVAVIYGKDQ